MREIISPNEKIKKRSYLLLKPNNKDRFLNWATEVIGVVRDYDNVNSLSGILSKVIKIFKVSCKIKEDENRCLAWYKKGFLLLTEPTTSKNFEDLEGDYVKVFIMNKREIERFGSIITKFNIINKLKDN